MEGHQHPMHQLTGRVLPQRQAEQLELLFKAFADRTRIRIMYALLEGELCVCEISDALDISQSAVSHQLRLLRQASLVRARRDGKAVYYSLDDAHVKVLLEQGAEHAQHRENGREEDV